MLAWAQDGQTRPFPARALGRFEPRQLGTLIVAVHESVAGTKGEFAAAHHSVSCSGGEQTKSERRSNVARDPDRTLSPERPAMESRHRKADVLGHRVVGTNARRAQIRNESSPTSSTNTLPSDFLR